MKEFDFILLYLKDLHIQLYIVMGHEFPVKDQLVIFSRICNAIGKKGKLSNSIPLSLYFPGVLSQTRVGSSSGRYCFSDYLSQQRSMFSGNPLHTPGVQENNADAELGYAG